MSQEALPEPLSYTPCYDFSMFRIPKKVALPLRLVCV